MNLLPLIQVFNATGERLQHAGLPLVKFDVASFMQEACRKTGLEDFGDQTFLDPLRLLLEACDQEANLSLVGRLAVKGDTIRLLTNRLRLIHDRQTYPEISQQHIHAPIFILGLPRTGSTLLHNLFAQDPANRVPRMWETMVPSPPPFCAGSNSANRIRHTEKLLHGFYWIAPKFKIVHPMTAQDPAECVTMMSHSFMSPQFQSTYHIPSYQKWLDNGNLRPAYLEHRQFLQHLQLGTNEHQWVLKAPPHIFGLEALLSVYPDANIIQTHRDPRAVLGSVASYDVILRQAFSQTVSPHRIGQEALTQWANAVQRGMNVRDTHAQAHTQFYDVDYTQLSQNPIGTMARLYDWLGKPLTKSTEQSMLEFLRNNPKHKHGEHRYVLSQFGVTEEEVISLFKSYIRRYNLDVHAVPSHEL